MEGLLDGLPSRGNFTSGNGNFLRVGAQRMPTYVCEHDTAPPGCTRKHIRTQFPGTTLNLSQSVADPLWGPDSISPRSLLEKGFVKGIDSPNIHLWTSALPIWTPAGSVSSGEEAQRVSLLKNSWKLTVNAYSLVVFECSGVLLLTSFSEQQNCFVKNKTKLFDLYFTSVFISNTLKLAYLAPRRTPSDYNGPDEYANPRPAAQKTQGGATEGQVWEWF
jgi:hypothetical protein